MPKRSSIGHVFGYAALTVLLSAGAAQSLTGSNTVFGDDIVDGTITTPDLKNGALSGSKILDNSVTGLDVNEASLGPVPRASNVLTGQINADGTIAAGIGRGITAVTRPGPAGSGQYTVQFTRDVHNCVAHVTTLTGPHTVAAQPFGVFMNVFTTTATGSAVDAPFYITVVC